MKDTILKYMGYAFCITLIVLALSIYQIKLMKYAVVSSVVELLAPTPH